MSSSLFGLLLLVLITLTAGVLWALSRWVSLRIAGAAAAAGAPFGACADVGTGDGIPGTAGPPGAEPPVAGQLRPHATVPAARFRRGRPAPYPLRDRSHGERAIADDLPPPSSRYEELSSLATADALPPADRLDAIILQLR